VPGTYEQVHHSYKKSGKHRPWLFKAFTFQEMIQSAGHLNHRNGSYAIQTCPYTGYLATGLFDDNTLSQDNVGIQRHLACGDHCIGIPGSLVETVSCEELGDQFEPSSLRVSFGCDCVL